MAGAVACSAAAVSQQGLRYVGLAALSSLGSELDLLAIRNSTRYAAKGPAVPPITRSVGWLIVSLLATVFFVVVIGRGLSL